jgi:hypothetical protein
VRAEQWVFWGLSIYFVAGWSLQFCRGEYAH